MKLQSQKFLVVVFLAITNFELSLEQTDSTDTTTDSTTGGFTSTAQTEVDTTVTDNEVETNAPTTVSSSSPNTPDNNLTRPTVTQSTASSSTSTSTTTTATTKSTTTTTKMTTTTVLSTTMTTSGLTPFPCCSPQQIGEILLLIIQILQEEGVLPDPNATTTVNTTTTMPYPIVPDGPLDPGYKSAKGDAVIAPPKGPKGTPTNQPLTSDDGNLIPSVPKSQANQAQHQDSSPRDPNTKTIILTPDHPKRAKIIRKGQGNGGWRSKSDKKRIAKEKAKSRKRKRKKGAILKDVPPRVPARGGIKLAQVSTLSPVGQGHVTPRTTGLEYKLDKRIIVIRNLDSNSQSRSGRNIDQLISQPRQNIQVETLQDGYRFSIEHNNLYLSKNECMDLLRSGDSRKILKIYLCKVYGKCQKHHIKEKGIYKVKRNQARRKDKKLKNNKKQKKKKKKKKKQKHKKNKKKLKPKKWPNRFVTKLNYAKNQLKNKGNAKRRPNRSKERGRSSGNGDRSKIKSDRTFGLAQLLNLGQHTS